MVTKKVAGRERELPPAAEIPRNWQEPRALVRDDTTSSTPSVSVAGSNRNQRGTHTLSNALALAAFTVGLFGVGIVWHHPVVGIVCVGAALVALTGKGVAS